MPNSRCRCRNSEDVSNLWHQVGLQALCLRSCRFSWDSLHDFGDSNPDVPELSLYLGMCLGALLTAFNVLHRETKQPAFRGVGPWPTIDAMPCSKMKRVPLF